MKFKEAKEIVEECAFPGYKWTIGHVCLEMYISAYYDEIDTVTGQIEIQHTRYWVLDLPTVTRSEIVATCFKCIITSHEHRVREWFTYQNKPIYQPHHDVDKLLSITEARA